MTGKLHKLNNGKEIVIREALVSDARGILAFARTLFASTDQVLTLPEEFIYTQTQEEQLIQEHAERGDALLLIAADGDKIVGLMNFSCRKKIKMGHSGEMGISVLHDYHKQGIGRAMIQMLIAWADNVSKVEKIYLNVFHTNLHAIRLYQSMGFIAEGRQAKAIRQPDGTYCDMITMSYFK